jgi:peptidoglycan/LPS O-acetylase OafA/YrhL
VFQFADYNRIPIANYLAALTFTSNYMFLIQPADVLNHLWSLAVEEHTYVILGALAFAARRHGWAPMPVLMALAAVCLLNGAVQTAILGNEDMRFVYWRTDVAMASILMGAIGWLWWTEKQRTVPGYLPMAALALALLLNLEPFPHPVKYGVAPALLAVAVVTLERAPRLMLALLCAPFLVQIGIWSFSLYLWQQPFYLMSVKLPLPLMLAGAVVTSLLSFYLVEQPARRALNARFAGRRRASVDPVPI